MPAAPTIDSSSSSSGEDETVLGVRMATFNLLPSLFEAGSSGSPFNANIRSTQTSRSPSPPPGNTTTGTSASGSGHSSAGKRPRSPQPTNPQRKNASSSGGQRRKSEVGSDAIAEMVEIGKQKLELVRQMHQSKVTNRANIPTIEACVSRVYALPGITPERVLAAGDALRDDKNRQLFMTMTDELAFLWVDRRVAMQNILYKQYFPGL